MVALLFIFLNFSITHADVIFNDMIRQSLIEESNLAKEVQQFAGIDQLPEKKSAAARVQKEADFKVVLRKKTQTKNPVIQRSIASKKNRVIKKLKKKKVK